MRTNRRANGSTDTDRQTDRQTRRAILWSPPSNHSSQSAIQHWRTEREKRDPTSSFTILEPKNPWIDEFNVVQERRAKCSSGRTRNISVASDWFLCACVSSFLRGAENSFQWIDDDLCLSLSLFCFFFSFILFHLISGYLRTETVDVRSLGRRKKRRKVFEVCCTVVLEASNMSAVHLSIPRPTQNELKWTYWGALNSCELYYQG